MAITGGAMIPIGVLCQGGLPDYWTEPVANPAYWDINDNGRSYQPLNASNKVATYIGRPKSSGKWFFAFNAVNSPNTNPPAVGVCRQSVINTANRGTTICTTGEWALAMYSGNVKYFRQSSSVYQPSPSWYLSTANTTPGIGGDLGGIGYDASTGIISCWKFDQYGTGTWVQKTDMATTTPGDTLVPFAVTSITVGSYVKYRPDTTPPAGFLIW